MKKNRCILVATLLICSVFALAVYLGTLPRPRITKSNFDRVKVGMPIQEVEQIFGEEADRGWDARRFVWTAKNGSVAIVFIDSDSRVASMNWTLRNETWWEATVRIIHTKRE